MAQVQLPPHWKDVTFGAQDLRLCQVTYQDLTEAPPLVVTRSLIVKQDHSWVLHVHGHLVDPVNVPGLQAFPPTLTSESATLLLIELADLRACIGNPEEKYVALGESKKNGQFLTENGDIVAYVDRNACIAVGEQKYTSTVRCSKCHILTNDMRCSVCTVYRRSLTAQCFRAVRLSSSVRSKKVNFR